MKGHAQEDVGCRCTHFEMDSGDGTKPYVTARLNLFRNHHLRRASYLRQAGAVYVFMRLPPESAGAGRKCELDREGDIAGNWEGAEHFKLQAHDAVAADRFGTAVSYLVSTKMTDLSPVFVLRFFLQPVLLRNQP